MKRFVGVVLMGWISVGVASGIDEVSAVSQDLTLIFRSARQVISDNQEKINDPALGYKGLSAAVVVEATKVNYKRVTHKNLRLNDDGSQSAKARIAMISAVKQVMDETQPSINVKGEAFKGFLPAVFAARVAAKFSKAMAGQYAIKLTAPMTFVRNRANKPDEWENRVIETRFKVAGYEKGKAFGQFTQVNGKRVYRYILPEYYGESCMVCHGMPRGGVDISGGIKEGAAVGDLGGAVSLLIYQ